MKVQCSCLKLTVIYEHKLHILLFFTVYATSYMYTSFMTQTYVQQFSTVKFRFEALEIVTEVHTHKACTLVAEMHSYFWIILEMELYIIIIKIVYL